MSAREDTTPWFTKNLAAGRLDTRGAGSPLIVYNPLGWSDQAPVEATVKFTGPAPATIHVFDTAMKENVPVQILERQGNTARILFLARVWPTTFKVFRVMEGAAATRDESLLRITESSLENVFYKVQIDANGDISSIFDNLRGRELLQAPIRLVPSRAKQLNRPSAWTVSRSGNTAVQTRTRMKPTAESVAAPTMNCGTCTRR